MTRIAVRGIATRYADLVRDGGPDANGRPALLRTAEGVANPCRHCLRLDDLEFDLRIGPATFSTDVFVEAQLQGMAVARARDVGTGCLPGYADVDAAHTATLRLTLPPARRSRRRAGSS